jgi:uncharacterized protein (TIGR01244 family)
MLRQSLALLALLALAACNSEYSHETLKVDLDSVVAEGRAVPVDGVTSAGQPDETAFRVFAESGYKTVIDMRMPDENRGLEEPALVEGLGMSYVPLPTSGDTITFDQARRLEELIEASDGPVLVHCASANRVGALFALSDYAENGDLDRALETGRKAGLTRLEGAVKEAIEAR